MKQVIGLSLALLLASTAAAQSVTGGTMVDAVTENCLPKLAQGVFDTQGLSPAEAALTATLAPGGGTVWRTADPGTVVVNPDSGFACQVLSERPDRRAISEGLRAWLRGAGARFRAGTKLGFTERNREGLYLFGRASDGEFIQIHIANLTADRVSALLTKSPDNPRARRALRR